MLHLATILVAWTILLFGSMVGAQDQFMPIDEKLTHDICIAWEGGGAKENMTAFIIELYPINEYGSVMEKITARPPCEAPCDGRGTWQSYVGQEWPGEIPNVNI